MSVSVMAIGSETAKKIYMVSFRKCFLFFHFAHLQGSPHMWRQQCNNVIHLHNASLWPSLAAHEWSLICLPSNTVVLAEAWKSLLFSALRICFVCTSKGWGLDILELILKKTTPSFISLCIWNSDYRHFIYDAL